MHKRSSDKFALHLSSVGGPEPAKPMHLAGDEVLRVIATAVPASCTATPRRLVDHYLSHDRIKAENPMGYRRKAPKVLRTGDKLRSPRPLTVLANLSLQV